MRRYSFSGKDDIRDEIQDDIQDEVTSVLSEFHYRMWGWAGINSYDELDRAVESCVSVTQPLKVGMHGDDEVYLFMEKKGAIRLCVSTHGDTVAWALPLIFPAAGFKSGQNSVERLLKRCRRSLDSRTGLSIWNYHPEEQGEGFLGSGSVFLDTFHDTFSVRPEISDTKKGLDRSSAGDISIKPAGLGVLAYKVAFRLSNRFSWEGLEEGGTSKAGCRLIVETLSSQVCFFMGKRYRVITGRNPEGTWEGSMAVYVAFPLTKEDPLLKKGSIFGVSGVGHIVYSV